jgi:hypothetical protein
MPETRRKVLAYITNTNRLLVWYKRGTIDRRTHISRRHDRQTRENVTCATTDVY